MRKTKKFKLLTSLIGSGAILTATPVVMTACSSEQTYNCTMDSMKWTADLTTDPIVEATPTANGGTYYLYMYSIKLDGNEIANESNSYTVLKKKIDTTGSDSTLGIKAYEYKVSEKITIQTIQITPTQSGNKNIVLKAKFASGWTGNFRFNINIE